MEKKKKRERERERVFTAAEADERSGDFGARG
jgi:hypothetical protein